ncbi:hypothetical protein NL868_001325 [Shigella flexneri]|nr:hypothetical protein [Shigella flexneri]
MSFLVDEYKRPKNLKLKVANAKQVITYSLKDIYELNYDIVYNGINTITFEVPYLVDIKNEIVKNPALDKIRERYFIKAIWGDKVEWYVITSISNTGNDEEFRTVECKLLAYELTYQKVLRYQQDNVNIVGCMEECVKNTNWKIGFIDPSFYSYMKSFDVSSKTKLDFLNEIVTAFNASVVFDTEQRIINLYVPDDTARYNGFTIKEGQYIQSIEEVIDGDAIKTRLEVKGSEDITFASVNPTGKSYIDDFSYFMIPYEKGIRSSYYMSDELCESLILHKNATENLTPSYQALATTKESYESQVSAFNTNIEEIKEQLKDVLDDIETEKKKKNPDRNELNTLTAKRDSLNGNIASVEKQLNAIQVNLNKVNLDIKSVNDQLEYYNFLSPSLLSELTNYISVEEWSSDNISSKKELLEAAKIQHLEVNAPPVNITMSLVNFLNVIEERHNWDRLNIGDIVKIKYDTLNIFVTAKITKISLDYENNTIQLEISNLKKVLTPQEEFIQAIYGLRKTKKEVASKKVDWQLAARNFNSRNDRIKTKPSNHVFQRDISYITHTNNDDGSVNIAINWEYPDYFQTQNDAHNIDGFEVFMYSSNLSDSYVFGSRIAGEEKVIVNYETRTLAFSSKSANKYHTFGIRAYRQVDPDINAKRYIYSDTIKFPNTPYKPNQQVIVNGLLNGKVNGTTYITADTEPATVEAKQTVFINTTTQEIKVADANGNLVNTNAGSANSLGGYSASKLNVPNTIATRDEYGVIDADITGDAETLGGYSAEEFLLFSKANRFATGNYIGDGTASKMISLPFTPTLVEIYTTNEEDYSLYIPSNLGGFLMSSGVSFYLSGNTPNPINGKLTTNGFNTGNDTNRYGNKLNVIYYWKAYYEPII